MWAPPPGQSLPKTTSPSDPAMINSVSVSKKGCKYNPQSSQVIGRVGAGRYEQDEKQSRDSESKHSD